MTAEIGIINQRGVALAADSAVTINKPDRANPITLNNAIKLFTLYNSNYVGMMIYQNANFMDIPWSILINSYKEYIGNAVKPHLMDYVNDFLTYINKLDIYTEQSEYRFVMSNAYAVLNILIDSNYQKVDDLENGLYKLGQQFQNKKLINVDFADFQKKYGEQIQTIFLNNYNNDIVKEFAPLFVKVVAELVSSSSFTNNYTGLVIAGYGSKELFPTVIKINLSGRYNGQIKYEIESQKSTDPINGNITSSIIPLAQHEMVDTVIRGVDPSLEDKFKISLEEIIGNIDNRIGQYSLSAEVSENLQNYVSQIVNRKYQEIENYIHTYYSDPIIGMLDSFSLTELGEIANTFVSLTAFKRKYSGDIRSVGGATKVLLISRENGAVWMDNSEHATLS